MGRQEGRQEARGAGGDGEIAGGSGEIVTRAGGQIIPVIRGSPTSRLSVFLCPPLSFLFSSFTRSVASFLMLKVLDRATMPMSAFI